MDRWSGKVAVVTGASSGIGWALSGSLLKANMIVIGLARRRIIMEELRETLPKNLRLNFFPKECDIALLESVRDVFHWIGEVFSQRIHVLINNAGTIEYSKLLDPGNEQALKQIIDVNLMGAVYSTKEAYHLMQNSMKNGEECHIINVNSLLGQIVPQHIPNCGFNLYPVSKHALRTFNEVLRRETCKDKLLRISNISPGLTETAFGSHSIKADHLDQLPKCVETLKPNDVANGILFILGSPLHVTVAELTMVPTQEKY